MVRIHHGPPNTQPEQAQKDPGTPQKCWVFRYLATRNVRQRPLQSGGDRAVLPQVPKGLRCAYGHYENVEGPDGKNQELEFTE